MSRHRTPSTASCSAGWRRINGSGKVRTAGLRPACRQDAGAPLLFLVPSRGEAQAQCVEADEAVGVALVVDLVFLEGDVGKAIEAVGRLPSDDPRQPLVELEPDPAFDLLLAL